MGVGKWLLDILIQTLIYYFSFKERGTRHICPMLRRHDAKKRIFIVGGLTLKTSKFILFQNLAL